MILTGISAYLPNLKSSVTIYFSESGRIVTVQKGAKVQRLIVTDGQGEGLTGQCMYFIKSKPGMVLNIRNIIDVSFFPCIHGAF